MAVLKHSISTPLFVGVLIPCVILDIVKIFLFFSQVIVVTIAIDIPADEIIGVIEDLLLGVLAFGGAFKGKNFPVSSLTMFANGVFNLIPEFDTFPSTTISAALIFWRSRAQDKKQYLAALKAEEAAERERIAQEERVLRAQEVVERLRAQ